MTAPLDPARLLWRTRGHRWDYLFLLRPTEPKLPGWFSIFEAVFRGVENAEPLNLRGKIIVRSAGRPDSVHHYVARALTDHGRRDFSGRTIRHFLLYALPEASAWQRLPEDWGAEVLASLAPALDQVFLLERSEGESSEQFSQRLLEGVRQGTPSTLPLSGEGAGSEWTEVDDLPVEDEKKVLGPASGRTGPKQTGWGIAIVLLALGLALLALPGSCR